MSTAEHGDISGGYVDRNVEVRAESWKASMQAPGLECKRAGQFLSIERSEADIVTRGVPKTDGAALFDPNGTISPRQRRRQPAVQMETGCKARKTLQAR